MKRINYSLKYYIFDSIIVLIGFAISIVSLLFLDGSVHWLVWVFYILFAVASLVCLFFLLLRIQWINIEGDYISACNIFGTVKRLELSKIQTARVVNARAWGVKIYSRQYSCIVISTRKSIKQSEIEDAYNHKKSNYIIFPNTKRNLEKLQDAYIKALGKELEI